MEGDNIEYKVVKGKEPNQWDLLDFMRKEKKWLTSNEVTECFGYERCASQREKISRKLNKLSRHGFLEKEVNDNSEFKRHEYIYKIKNGTRTKS